MQKEKMKIVTINMDLVIDEDMVDIEKIARYLTKKLYEDPEFFGDFGPENISKINLEDGTPVYKQGHGYYKWIKKEEIV